MYALSLPRCPLQMSTIHLPAADSQILIANPAHSPTNNSQHVLSTAVERVLDLDFDSLVYCPEQPFEVGHHYHPLTKNETEALREKPLFQLVNTKAWV